MNCKRKLNPILNEYKMNISQKTKPSQSENLVNPKKNQVNFVNDLNNSQQTDCPIQKYKEQVADLYEDPELRRQILNNIIWAGGENPPSYRLKNLKGSYIRIAFFFIKYHYETNIKGVIYDPSYDNIEKCADVCRNSIARAIRMFECIGGLEVTRKANKQGRNIRSSYEVNIYLMEKFIADNFHEIEFYDDENGKRKPRLKRFKKPRSGKKQIIHKENVINNKNVQKMHRYNIEKDIVNKKGFLEKNVDNFKSYTIPIKELFQNLYDKILNEMLFNQDNILKKQEIKQSMNAFYKMCLKENLKDMPVYEFKRRIKAWISSFNSRVMNYIARKGYTPRWKSLRRKLSDIWSEMIVSLEDNFVDMVRERLKVIFEKRKKKQTSIIDREKIWKAKEILIGKKNYLVFEEDAINIIANYIINLK